MHSQASEALEDANIKDHDLMKTMIAEIKRLRTDLENTTQQLEKTTAEHSSELLRLSIDLKTAYEDIEKLNDEQVEEEHFFINDSFDIPGETYLCMEEFVVPSGKIIDLSAAFASATAKDNGTTSGALYLEKNGEKVASHRHVKGIPGTWFSHTA